MNILFRPLFTVAVSHSYYAERCRDFRFVVPDGTAAELRRGRLMARELDGALHVLYEADAESGEPRVKVPGARLRFGLRLGNPYFSNFTAVDAEFPRVKPRFTNAADPAALAPAPGVRMVGETFAHTLGGPERPATATLRDVKGTLVGAATLQAGDASPSVSFDLRDWPGGLYVADEERDGGIVRQLAYYRDPELQRQDASAVIEVVVGEAFYAAPPALEAEFTARAEVLSYYVIAHRYAGAELDALQVTDEDPAVPQADRAVFTRFGAGEFPAGALDPALVAAGEPVVLFRSQGPLNRRERGRRRIQLSKNDDDVLIANLPQPGPEQARADVIVHLTKP
jgi:hypothetical protein